MYKRTITLEDNQSPAKVNRETGEIEELRNIFNSIPDDKELWLKSHTFSKMFTHSWKFLAKKLNSDELKVLVIMVTMAKIGTNSMPPLNDSVSMSRLEEHFGVSRKKMPKILDNLYRIGCYGKFKVATVEEPYKQYWILNPYISFKGRLIPKDIARLFNGTMVEIEFVKSYNRFIGM
jgi:hypothetical protein